MSAIDPNTIDVTQPPAVNPTTSGLRAVIAAIKALFSTAKSEIEGLQQTVASLEPPAMGAPVGVQSFRGGNDIPFSFNPQKGNEQGTGPEFAAKDHKHGFVLELGASRWSNAYLLRKILPIPAVPPHTDNGDRTYDGRIILDGTLGVILRERVPVSLEGEEPPEPSWQMAGCPSIYIGDTEQRDAIHLVDLGPGARGARLFYNTDAGCLQVYIIDQETGQGTWHDVGSGEGGTLQRADLSEQCDGERDTFVTPDAYRAGTLEVWIDGLYQGVPPTHFVDVDPAEGRFRIVSAAGPLGADTELVVKFVPIELGLK